MRLIFMLTSDSIRPFIRFLLQRKKNKKQQKKRKKKNQVRKQRRRKDKVKFFQIEAQEKTKGKKWKFNYCFIDLNFHCFFSVLLQCGKSNNRFTVY